MTGGKLREVSPGIWYYPVIEAPYDQAYFDKYLGYEDTEVGKRLTEARVALVQRHWLGAVMDIGIGSGQFIKAMPPELVKGFDINPAGVRWLQERGLFCNPYHQVIEAGCFWDSLEHIKHPDLVLDSICSWVFISIPIFTDRAHVLRSKHFRTDEHYWYFTEEGLTQYMSKWGFERIEISRIELECGREDICSYAFRRRKP